VTESRVALVTGGSRGIGKAIVERLREDGWHVETAELSSGVDLADPEAARSAVERLGRIDALVCNAATTWRGPAVDVPLEEWRRVLDVDLTAPFVMAQAAARRMLEADGGSIVFVASLMSFVGGVNIAPYTAAKGGLALLTKALSNELAPQGIRVNAVAPGYVETGHTATLEDWKRRQVLERIPLGRFAQPEEIAPAVSWLLGTDASYVTGTVLTVDGGFLAR